jgi:hypothetical protein
MFGSEISHVGIVYKDANKNLFIVEYEENGIGNSTIPGLYISPLANRLYSYEGVVIHKPLYPMMQDDMVEKFEDVIQKYLNMDYLKGADGYMACYGIRRDKSKYATTCSGVISQMLIEMGLLEIDMRSECVIPEHFKNIQLVYPYRYSTKEYKIKMCM